MTEAQKLRYGGALANRNLRHPRVNGRSVAHLPSLPVADIWDLVVSYYGPWRYANGGFNGPRATSTLVVIFDYANLLAAPGQSAAIS